MNRSRAKELLPIIQAFAEGKEIQYISNGEWVDYGGYIDWTIKENRIKPEPEVIYVNKEGSGEFYPYASSQAAKSGACDAWEYEYIAKKFIEVIDSSESER